MALNFQKTPSPIQLKKSTIQGTAGHAEELASAAKQSEHFGQDVFGDAFQKELSGRTRKKGEKSEFQKLSDWEDAKTKEEALEDVQKVLTKTDKDIALVKKKNLSERKLQHQKDILAFEKKKYTDKTSTKKTGPSIEQQLADKKFKDLKKEKIRLGEKGYAKGWSDKKLARKDKRLTKKIKKAEKMTDPLARADKAMEMAKAQDIFKALSMGGSKWTGSRTAAQDALKKQQQKGLIDQDVSAVTDAENKTKLDPGESFVYDYTKGKDYSKEAGDVGLGFKEKGKVDYGTWSDEDLEKRRTDPTYRPS